MGRGRLRCFSCCAPLPSHLESSLLTPPSPCKAVSLSVSPRNGAWGKPQTCAVPSWQPQSPCWSQQPLWPPHLLLSCCCCFYPPSAAARWRIGVPPKTTAQLGSKTGPRHTDEMGTNPGGRRFAEHSVVWLEVSPGMIWKGKKSLRCWRFSQSETPAPAHLWGGKERKAEQNQFLVPSLRKAAH